MEGDGNLEDLRDRVHAHNELLGGLVHDLLELARSAALFFRGFYPIEAPYFWWGEALRLPWADEYSAAGDDETLTPLPIRRDVSKMLRALGASLDALHGGAGCGQTYLDGALCATPKLKVQGLAVETMWAVDRCLDQLAQANAPVAMHFLARAYQNLFECTCQAQLLLGIASTNARKAALARHRENHAMKAEVQRWYEQNKGAYRSMDAAAAAAAGKVVPVTMRTVRGWIGEYARSLRAARRP